MPYQHAPRIPAKTERTPRGTWLLHVDCPYCGQEHTHGGGNGNAPALFGRRETHCLNGFTYDVRPPSEPADWEAEWRAALSLKHANR